MRIDLDDYFGALEGSRRGDLERVAHFLQAGHHYAWRRATKDQFEFDALVWTLALGEIDFASALIDAGLRVRVRSVRGESALSVFVQRRDKRALCLLVEKGAGLDEAMRLAVEAWDLDLIDLFLQLGADPEAAMRDESLAGVHGEVLRYLSAQGATLPPAIAELVERRMAVGDHGHPPMPPRRPL